MVYQKHLGSFPQGSGCHPTRWPCHGQGWTRSGAASSHSIPECCLPGRNRLLAASLPAGAGQGTLVPPRDHSRMGHDGVGCDRVPMGATSSQDKTWILPKRPLPLVPPVSQRSQAIWVSKLPSLGAVTGHPMLLHGPAESAGKQDNSEKETRAIAQGEAFGGRLLGSAGRSTQAAPGAVLIPAAQALPSLPIHCRCAGKQGARDPGSPHPQPAHASRGTAPSPPCPGAAGSTGACPLCGLLPHIIQHCHEPPSPQVFGAIMQSRSISTPAPSSPQSPPRRPSVSPGRAWGRHPRLQGALGAPGTLQLTGDSLLAPACPLQLPRAFLCQKHSVSICSAAINQRDAHTSTGRRWAPQDQGAARCLRQCSGPERDSFISQCFSAKPSAHRSGGGVGGGWGVPGHTGGSLSSPGCLAPLQPEQSKQGLLRTLRVVPEGPQGWLQQPRYSRTRWFPVPRLCLAVS